MNTHTERVKTGIQRKNIRNRYLSNTVLLNCLQIQQHNCDILCN